MALCSVHRLTRLPEPGSALIQSSEMLDIDALRAVLSNVLNPKQTSLSEATDQTGLLRPRIV